jgi:inner membrane protein
MPTLLTHPAVALLKTFFPRLPVRAAAAGAVLSLLPDLDVIGFRFDVAYSAPLGHRGFTHSIVFALLSATIATLLIRSGARLRRAPFLHRFAFLFLCAVSHPLLDAMTDGGLGIAFFAPFRNHRYFFPWRPIRVSPIGARFFSARGLETLKSEALWVWLPLLVLSLGKYIFERQREAGKQR